MRNWNTILQILIYRVAFLVFIVPMRNWNYSTVTTLSNSTSPVFIVPMRNWNLLTRCFEAHLLLCFYRTYEELKPKLKDGRYVIIVVFIVPMRNWNQAEDEYIKYILKVFIVPMRNWNIILSPSYLPFKFLFLSYLWGIETLYSFEWKSNA